MLRPTRCCGGRSRLMKGLSERTIPTLRSDTTISPFRFRIKASMARPIALSAGDQNRRESSRWGSSTVATLYSNLGQLLTEQGKYAEAAPLLRRAIEIDERALGKDYPDVARAYNNLALSLWHQGKYAEADPLYRRAIEIDEKALGRDHPTFATLYNNLAQLLTDQGKYAEADPLWRRAIEIDERALGKDHPDVAIRYR